MATGRRVRWGQHFLRDPRIVRRIIDAAAISPEEAILEIGPGEGVLTRELTARARRVVVVERDRGLAALLAERLGGPTNLEVIVADAVDVDLSRFGCDAVVSNLPYEISSPITFRFAGLAFSRLLLMFQQEFAARLVAAPFSKDYGRLSVAAQLRFHIERLFEVPAAAFSPPPKVESAVLRLRPHPGAGLTAAEEDALADITRAAFAGRRKKLANALAALAAREPAVGDGLGGLGLSSLRADQVPPADYARLAAYVASSREARSR